MDARERREKLQKLVNLEKIYIDVMYYRFLDQTVPEITETLHIPNVKTTYTRFTRIYEQLGIEGEDKEKELIRQYSPILLEFVKSKDDLDNWGHIRAEMYRQINAPVTQADELFTPLPASQSEKEVSEATNNKAAPGTAPISATPQQPKGTKPGSSQPGTPSGSPWIIPGLLLLVGCLICISGGLILRPFIPGFGPTNTPGVPIPSNTVAPTIASPVSISETSLPPATNTLLPDTPTGALTDTALPTLSPTPSATVLFLDDFHNGRSPEWQRVYGSEPIIVNGSLTFNDSTLMLIGSKDWTDYEVSFYVSNMSCQEHVASRGLTVGLRVQDANNMVALRINDQDYCGGTWVQIQNGKWNKVPNADFKFPPVDSNGGRQITIRVQGNAYSTPIGSSVVIENYPSGGVAFLGAKGVTIDNVRITALNP